MRVVCSIEIDSHYLKLQYTYIYLKNETNFPELGNKLFFSSNSRRFWGKAQL